MIVVSNQGASPGSVTHEDRLQSYVTLTGSVPFFFVSESSYCQVFWDIAKTEEQLLHSSWDSHSSNMTNLNQP